MRSAISKWIRSKWRGQDDRPNQLREEVQFWRSWFETRGLEWPEDYVKRLNPKEPIQDHVARYIDRLEGDCIHILDVGAGPLTKLGKVHASKQIVITATDLLAHEYDRLLDECKIKPLVRTVFADTEKLVDQFGENAFDIVHGQNCVDHTANPLRAIEQMLKVTRLKGFVVLFHVENEGKKESYGQLHKWDFTCENGDFMVRGPHESGINVSKMLAPVGDFECILAKGNILTAIRKKRPVEISD